MNIRAMLLDLGLEIYSENRRNYNFWCPFHSDNSPSFSISKDDGKWLCRTGCGSGKHIESFIRKFKKCSGDEARKYVAKFSDPVSDLLYVLNKKEEGFYEKDERSSIIPPEVSLPIEFELVGYPGSGRPTAAFDYLHDRGISSKIIHQLGIGFCKTGRYHDRIIIPIMMFGKIRGFLARTILPEPEKRYLNAEDVEYSHLLFGYDRFAAAHSGKGQLAGARRVFLCESTFDALTYLSWEYLAVATFGAHLSARHIELLLSLGVTDLVIAYHNDEAGNTDVNKNVTILTNLFPTVSRLLLPPDRDVNELTREECEDIQAIRYVTDSKLPQIQKAISWKLQKLKIN